MKLNGERRYMLTTRKDGTIFIEVDNEGKYAIWGEQLEDNIKSYNTVYKNSPEYPATWGGDEWQAGFKGMPSP